MEMKECPEVSIFCITYNQVDYIEECMDSILSQKTSFKFELLINDDCSNDGTREKIEEYASRFPDVVKPVFHSSNQSSKGINPTSEFLFPRAAGRYYALCEGDDFWVDDNKLQIQYDLMEKNPETMLCGHASANVSADERKILGLNRPFGGTGFYTFRDFVGIKQIPPMATASLFIRKEAYEKYVYSGYVKKPAHGDFKMEMLFTALAPMAYIDKVMSAYRVLAKGSINRDIMRRRDWRDIERKLTQTRVDYLRDMELVAPSDRIDGLSDLMDDIEYKGALAVSDLSTLLGRWRDRFAAESLGRRAKTIVYSCFPLIQDSIRIIKSYL